MAAGEVFWTFLKLGCTSFGGPSAHIGYFRTAFVERLGWMSERRYAELVALGQFLPGPASSQVGFAVGLERAGAAGGAAAWAGFTLPSALIMLLAAFGLAALPPDLLPGIIHGLKLVAVAVVLHAVQGMVAGLCQDRLHKLLGVGALVLALLAPGVAGQLSALVLAGLAAFLLADRSPVPEASEPAAQKKLGSMPFVLIGLAIALLLLLPLAAQTGLPGASIAEPFYRAGSLVFGGGHVVLPFLETATVGQGWLSEADFLAGYGVAQAIPGPLFTFATYVGAVSFGVIGGLIALIAIFAPGLLLMAGGLPVWTRLSHLPGLRRALGGVNAGVVGILAAALYDPLWTSSVAGAEDVAAVAIGWAMLQVLKWPSWTVALAGLGYGLVLAVVW
jgi:chromate transporter